MKNLLFPLLAALLLLSPVSVAENNLPQDIPCYGTPSETSVLCFFTNNTQETILQLRIRRTVQDTMAIETLPDLLGGDIFPAGATIGVWFDLQIIAGQDDAVQYEIMLTFENDKVWTLHGVSVADIEKAVICHDENVAWLTYSSIATGQEISTWIAELNTLSRQEANDTALVDDAQPEITLTEDDLNS